MTRPRDPARYPIAFRTLVDTVHAKGEVTVPSADPYSLRSQLYGYLESLRRSGLPELADAILITTLPSPLPPKTPGSLVLRLRDNSQSARDVLSALETILGNQHEPS